jgi:hypothetical protein
MKNAIFFVLTVLFFGNNVLAQDYCKQLKKEVTNGTTFNYCTPYDTTTIPPIKVTRSFSIDSDLAFDNFVLNLQISSDLAEFFKKNPAGDGEYDEKKLVVDFDDKTSYVDNEILINYDLMNDENIAVRKVFIALDEKTLPEFSGKTITKFSFGGMTRKLTPDSAKAYRAFIKCMDDAHK